MKSDEGGWFQVHMFYWVVSLKEPFLIFEDAFDLLSCPYFEWSFIWASLSDKSEDDCETPLLREMKMLVSFGAFFVHRILVFLHQVSFSFEWVGVASDMVLVGGKSWCTWRSVGSFPDWWEEEDLVSNILNLLLLKEAAKSVWKVIRTSVNGP